MSYVDVHDQADRSKRRYLRGPLASRLHAGLVSGRVHPVLGSPCLVWTGAADRKGYGHINTGGGRNALVHRVAYELANGTLPAGRAVLHHCDNPPCCNPAHLFLGTIADNNADMRAKGRHAQGERVGSARLTRASADTIRASYRAGVRVQDLADRHGIAKRTIYDILQGRTWREATAHG